MSLNNKEKLEIAQVVDVVFAHRMAEICDNIEKDMKECIVDLLLQLGPLLASQNRAAVEDMVKKAREEADRRRGDQPKRARVGF